MDREEFKEMVKNVVPAFAVDKLRGLKNRFHFRNQVIGMTTRNEQAFYRACTQRYAHLDGAIVDLGCWMGSTSISLARGIRDNKESTGKKVYAFDRFVWEDWMNSFQYLVKRDYESGDSFLPEVKWRVRRYLDEVRLIESDLSEYAWQDGPINILLVDAMKNIELTKSIATSFFPSLVKGGILIHQDFKHYFTPWIHILQYRLRRYFEPYEDVPESATLAFRCVRQMTCGDVAGALNFETISDRELKDVFRYSMGCVSDSQKSAVAAAHIMFFVHKNLPLQAKSCLSEYSVARLQETNDFKLAENEVNRMSAFPIPA